MGPRRTLEDMATDPEPGRDRFKKLPEHVALEDTVEGQPTNTPPDPDGGRDPEHEFFMRNIGL